MLLMAGLGNPGPKYCNHRHNLGFHVMDRVAGDWQFPAWRSRFEALVSERRVEFDSGGARNARKVILLKPMTFYNDSGRALARAAQYFRLDASDIVLFHDEIDLVPGKIRGKQGGHHAGNKGVLSVHQHLGTEVRRVRLGVGHPGAREKVNPHVLSDFSSTELVWRDALLDSISGALPDLIAGDDARFVSEVMRLVAVPQNTGTA